jgi:hypothetical protein
MSLFVDREIPVENNSIVVELAWHSKVPLLAIGAYSEEKGGNVRLVDGSGSATEEADPIPPHATAQVNHCFEKKISGLKYRQFDQLY